MKKSFLLVSLICSVIMLIAAENLFSQRGMKISIRTPEGEEIPLYKDSYALVVGNGNYTNGWKPLEGALRDVKEIETTLKKHGFQVTLKTDLSKAAFDRVFAEFVLRSGKDKDNRLLFYYAGHGYTRKSATNADLGYLVMVDAPTPHTDEVGFELESIAMESLVTQAEKIQARHALFVFDSCFSGTILNMRDEQKPPESISDSIKYPVRQFITAGRAGEPVPDNSDFKQVFLDLLEGREAEPFPDGYITGEELGYYLKHKVPQYNAAQHPQYGKIRNPKLDKGDFVFVLGNTDGSGGRESLPTLATLRVTSTPSGATVYLDSKQIGSTPLREYHIDTGVRRQKQVEIGLELSGYRSHVERLTLRGGQITPLDMRLEKLSVPSVSIPAGMVLIPAGEFQMGSHTSPGYELPVHTVYVDAFYMDKYEVTNSEYKRFVDANPQWRKDRIPESLDDGDYLDDWRGNTYPDGKGNHPVVNVNWYAAMAYSKWAGKRLPTEAEWEKAARGSLVGKKYPWGDTIDESKTNYNRNVGDTTPVGRYPANGYGLYDMAGNVHEWCLDASDRDFYSNSPRANPIAGGQRIDWLLNNYTRIKSMRVMRGGAWYSTAFTVRCAQRGRSMPTHSSLHFPNGFRCVKAVTP